tara:strand:- start:4412 stop:5737 length:1326 start_codon:yes stop_codon:yes gene_type:complete
MKSFQQFISESAAQQALRLGLEGDGHGGWYKDGEFTAKTEKGRLRFYNKRQKAGQDPPQTEKEKNLSHSSTAGEEPATVQSPVSPQQIPNPAAQQGEAPAEDPAAAEGPEPGSPQAVYTPPDVPKTKGTLSVGFGRFNPPHMGHGQLMDIAAGSARDSEEESDYMIVPSKSTGKDTDPLDFETKVKAMKEMFPHHSSHINDDPEFRTLLDVLKYAHNEGYANVRIIAGGKRVKQFGELSQKYNGALYDFGNLETLSSGDRDEDGEGIEAMSATTARQAALDNDYDTFSSQLPKDDKGNDFAGAEDLFKAVRKALGVEDDAKKEKKKEVKEWKIAPKLHARELREYYIRNEIYNTGDKVQDLNNGLTGRIMRRGTNYVICVSEDKIMFKSWITDITEATFTQVSGVPASQREVGTDSLRKYTERLTPGSTWGREFINRYRKK